MEPMENFKNRTVWTGDNLPILRGINNNSIDLIYLDPPFNSNKSYSAPIGSRAAGAAFKDSWSLSDLDVAWIGLIADEHPAIHSILHSAGLAHGKGMQAYLCMMAVRLIEMHRILKDIGSLYLHCDPTASHYLKLLLDAIFKQRNFRNEITWAYRRWPSKQQNFQRMHDIVLRYSRTETVVWNQLHEDHSPSSRKMWKGKRRVDVTDPATGKRHSVTVDEPSPGVPMRDVWDISVIHPAAKERVGYPTQKPRALLERIIKASSNKGDIILDPFAGCATACVAAEALDRQWIGIDLSPLAYTLVQERLAREVRVGSDETPQLTPWKVTHRTDLPTRSDTAKLAPYTTHRHTLFGKQEGRCGGCRMDFPFKLYEVDHIVPRSKGGTDSPENLQLLCGHCNKTKGAQSQAYLVARLQELGYLP